MIRFWEVTCKKVMTQVHRATYIHLWIYILYLISDAEKYIQWLDDIRAYIPLYQTANYIVQSKLVQSKLSAAFIFASFCLIYLCTQHGMRYQLYTGVFHQHRFLYFRLQVYCGWNISTKKYKCIVIFSIIKPYQNRFKVHSK